jgi:hypothetical protein
LKLHERFVYGPRHSIRPSPLQERTLDEQSEQVKDTVSNRARGFEIAAIRPKESGRGLDQARRSGRASPFISWGTEHSEGAPVTKGESRWES